MALLTLVCVGVDRWIVVEDEGWVEEMRGIKLRPGSARSGGVVFGPSPCHEAELFIANRNHQAKLVDSQTACEVCGQFRAMHKDWKWCAPVDWEQRVKEKFPDAFQDAMGEIKATRNAYPFSAILLGYSWQHAAHHPEVIGGQDGR